MDAKNDFQKAGEQGEPSIFREFWLFLVENKKWWMLPIVAVFALVATLMFFAGTGAAPFIYTLF